MIGSDKHMSLKEQCELVGVPRSSHYFRPESDPKAGDEMLMRAIDRVYMEEPTFGTRLMRDALCELGHQIGRGRVRHMMRGMGIEPIYPTPRLCGGAEGGLARYGIPEIFNTDHRGFRSATACGLRCAETSKSF